MSPLSTRQTRMTPPLVLRVKIQRGTANQKEFTFSKPFFIGREEPCEIRLQDGSISRRHAEVYLREGCWWIRDLNSANGTYVDGNKIDRLPLTRPILIEFGSNGPMLFFEEEEVPGRQATLVKRPSSVTQYVKRYFSPSPVENMGQHTLLIRQVFQRLQKKQKSKYLGIIAAIAALLIITAGYAIIQQKKIRELRQDAINIFYEYKKSELNIANLRDRLNEAGKIQDLKELEAEGKNLDEMKKGYNQLVEKLGVYKKNVAEDEKLILEVARIFGECELNPSPGFVQEVRRYIKKWQSKNWKNRLTYAITRAKENKYALDIASEMVGQRLPPHFFYLALQESDFSPKECGPRTRIGFAKGMWMFMPDTAKQYGLQIGPLYQLPQYDSEDERHDFMKSTRAAARYLRYIYDTDAQASGLLVIASYNWGENRVIGIIRCMPKNPQERNFWKLLEKHMSRIPEETYDYVFRIFSAAVIGKNPKLFGFDFDNPLAEVEGLYSQ
jgi:pSer/pThr/pTyr-binding forkhead associated (FHA) protein